MLCTCKYSIPDSPDSPGNPGSPVKARLLELFPELQFNYVSARASDLWTRITSNHLHTILSNTTSNHPDNPNSPADNAVFYPEFRFPGKIDNDPDNPISS